jgi:hypothetical protein
LSSASASNIKSTFNDTDPSFSPDRRWLAYQDRAGREHEVVMLQNFFDELRRKVPVGKRSDLPRE